MLLTTTNATINATTNTATNALTSTATDMLVMNQLRPTKKKAPMESGRDC